MDTEEKPHLKFDNSGLFKYEPVDEPLSKRERFAMAAMQGLAAWDGVYGDKGIKDMTEKSVKIADALLTELND